MTKRFLITVISILLLANFSFAGEHKHDSNCGHNDTEVIIGPAGADGRDGKDGLSIVGPQGPQGIPGESIIGPQGYTYQPIGTSFLSAGQSFEGSGIGVGLGGGNGTKEISAVAGVALKKNVKVVAGFTHFDSGNKFLKKQNRFSVGVGISFD